MSNNWQEVSVALQLAVPITQIACSVIVIVYCVRFVIKDIRRERSDKR